VVSSVQFPIMAVALLRVMEPINGTFFGTK